MRFVRTMRVTSRTKYAETEDAMPWRLLGFIFFLGIVLVFSVSNRKNVCDISLGFATLKDVPVYLTVFASFLFGLVCSLPYAVSAYLRLRREKKLSSGGNNPPRGKKPQKERGKNSTFAGGKGDGAAAAIDPDYGID